MDLDARSALSDSTLLGNMPKEALARIVGRSDERSYLASETVFHQGEAASWVFVVLEGLVKLSLTSRAGAEIIVDVFGTGESFAEALAFRQGVYPVTATAILPTRVMAIPISKIRSEIHGAPDVLDAVMAATFAQLHRLVEQVERLKGDSSLQRTARFILSLAEKSGPSFDIPFQKQTIAGLIGVKPETLSRNFKRLQDHGVRIQGETVLIKDLAKLRAYILDGTDAF